MTPEWKAKKWGQCDGNPSFDVAILKEKSVEQGYHNHLYIPHTLIEIKNAYSPFILGYEASDSVWEYKNGGGIASDIKKMCDARRGQAGIVDFHAILAVNCPRKHRSEKYRFIASNIPNYTSLNKLMIGYKNDFSRIIEDLTIKLRAEAEKFNPTDISFVTLYGGQAYENEMDIVFMILSF